jgi:hypothetical protein
MDSPHFIFSLAYPQLYALYLMAVCSAISLFLFFYIRNLLSQGKRGNVDESASKLSVWLNLMYPSWLDRLTYQGIIRAFVWALGLAIVAWTILAMVFVVVIMKVYSP